MLLVIECLTRREPNRKARYHVIPSLLPTTNYDMNNGRDTTAF